MNLSAAAMEAGLSRYCVEARIRKQGMSLEEACSYPSTRYDPRGIETSDPALLADLLAGESPARILAERYGTTPRTICRARARLRKQGYRVRVPE